MNGHLLPGTLIVLYLGPALLGLYAFRDLQAALVASGLLLSIACYYVGFHAMGVVDRARERPETRTRMAWLMTPNRLQQVALATLGLYGCLVLYLALTSENIALWVALRSGDMTEITAAREAFVQTRSGGEAITRYLNAIFFRVLVPCSLVILYAYGNRWRHVALGAMLFCALLSLEKTLTAYILVPLGVYFLLAGRTKALGAFVLAGALIVGVTILGTGTLSELRGDVAADQPKLLTDRWGDRKNMFWILQWLALAAPGKPLQDALGENPIPFSVSEDGRLVPQPDEGRTGRDAPEAPPASSSSATASAVPTGPAVRDAETWRALQYRNLITNGDMGIAETAHPRMYTPPHSAYVAARWLAVLTAGRKLTFEQSEDAPEGFTHSLKITVAEAYEPRDDDVFEVQQRIDGFKVSDLALGSGKARTMTLSFWVKASLPGVYNATFASGRWTRSYLVRYEVLKPNEWEHKVIVTPGDSAVGEEAWPTHGHRLVVNFNLGVGAAYRGGRTNEWQNTLYRQSLGDAVTLVSEAGAALQLTGVQLEIGSTPTPFEHRAPEAESALAHTRPPFVGETLVKLLPDAVEHQVADALEDFRVQALLRRTLFIVNRVAWVPYITAYDWFRFHHEVLKERFLKGSTIGVLASARGGERYPIEQEIFKYQYGVSATATATANAVYFADAYVNFGWAGVVLYSLLIGAIFRVVVASRSLPLLAVSVMSTFSLMVASFPANLLSGGLALLLLLAWIFREPPVRESPA